MVLWLVNSVSLLINKDDQKLDHIIHLFSLGHENEKVIDLTRKYCLQSSSLETQKKGMEFLFINRLYDDLQLLIDKNKQSKYILNEQWAQVYQLMLDQKTKPHLAAEVINSINLFETDDPVLKCLLEFIIIEIYVDMNDYRIVSNSLENVENLITKIQDPFLLNSFRARINHTMFLYYWARNEVIIARKFAYQLLNQTLNYEMKANIHMKLGLSYLFETYSQGMYHLKKALKIAKEHHMPYYTYIMENNNIPFFSAHFKRVDGLYSEDKSEQAHLEIAKGNYDKAIRILNELPLDTPFQLYYMGLAKQDKHYLLQSYESFIKDRSNYFFSRLPLNAIKEMNLI